MRFNPEGISSSSEGLARSAYPGKLWPCSQPRRGLHHLPSEIIFGRRSRPKTMTTPFPLQQFTDLTPPVRFHPFPCDCPAHAGLSMAAPARAWFASPVQQLQQLQKPSVTAPGRAWFSLCNKCNNRRNPAETASLATRHSRCNKCNKSPSVRRPKSHPPCPQLFAPPRLCVRPFCTFPSNLRVQKPHKPLPPPVQPETRIERSETACRRQPEGPSRRRLANPKPSPRPRWIFVAKKWERSTFGIRCTRILVAQSPPPPVQARP